MHSLALSGLKSDHFQTQPLHPEFLSLLSHEGQSDDLVDLSKSPSSPFPLTAAARDLAYHSKVHRFVGRAKAGESASE
jgi:hypothetical protein